MEVTTYIIGAGASANSIPLDNSLVKNLDGFITLMRQSEFRLPDEPFPNGYSKSQYKLQAELINELGNLKSELEHISERGKIDTLAHSQKNSVFELKRLKTLVSCFFIYLEAKKRIDSRYNDIIPHWYNHRSREFENNIRVLSWNYDLQIEKAIGTYLGLTDWDEIRFKANIFSKIQMDPIKRDQFSIFKLNGSATYFTSDRHEQYSVVDEFRMKENRELVFQLCSVYDKMEKAGNEFLPALSFAFEEDFAPGLLYQIKNSVSTTKKLVVLGYSFPGINRFMDEEILSFMDISTVIIYDTDPEPIKDRMMQLFPKNFRSHKQFALKKVDLSFKETPFPIP